MTPRQASTTFLLGFSAICLAFTGVLLGWPWWSYVLAFLAYLTADIVLLRAIRRRRR